MSVIFKCKMCGGDLDIKEGSTIAECLYCGRKQTLPKLDDDKRRNLYDRANHFRQSGDFDKAMTIYEQILSEDNTDAEAYWSLVLCRYGIEYVEDPATHQRVPTVNRTQPVPVTSDEDYKQALHYADDYQTSIYEEEAKAIDEIQKGILEISRREKPFDVFICYKESDNNGQRTPDSVLAVDLYDQLTKEGFKVFCSRITLEDKLGEKYEPYIFAALNSAPVMVALGTKPEYFNAVWVRNEWSRYLTLIKNGARKTLIPAYRDMSPYDLPDEFAHLQAQDMSKLGFMQDLIRGVKKILEDKNSKTQAQQSTSTNANSEVAPLLERAFMFLEDGDYKKADEYCEKVLDKDPKNARAYLGKLMAELKVRKQTDLANLELVEKPFDNNSNYQKVMRYGDEALVSELEECVKLRKKKIEIANRKKDDDYNTAIRLMNEGKYKEAIDIFDKFLREFVREDKTERAGLLEKVKECEYMLGLKYMEEGNYRKALSIFGLSVWDRLDFLDRMDFFSDKSARAFCSDKSKLRENARKFWSCKDITDYRDSREKAEECRQQVYIEGCNLMREGKYDEAKGYFYEIKGYRDANVRYNQCMYPSSANTTAGGCMTIIIEAFAIITALVAVGCLL